jgi:hypothetical protein
MWSSLVVEVSGELEEHLLHVGNVVAGSGRSTWVLEAPGQTSGDHQEPNLLECLVRRGDLGHDIAAITTLRKHLLKPANLTLNPSQAALKVGQR